MDESGKDSSKNRGAITILNKGSVGWEERVREGGENLFFGKCNINKYKIFFQK
jgi:hypothetical protein